MNFRSMRMAALCLMTLATPLAAQECRQVHSKLTFCGGEKAWNPLKSGTHEGVAMFRNSGQSFGKVIVETIKPGQVSRKQVEDAILLDLAVNQGDKDGSFTVDRLEAGEVDGEMVGNLSYTLPGKKNPLHLLHSYLVKGDLLIQFITITSSSIADDSARDLHRDFMGGFRITRTSPLL